MPLSTAILGMVGLLGYFPPTYVRKGGENTAWVNQVFQLTNERYVFFEEMLPNSRMSVIHKRLVYI